MGHSRSRLIFFLLLAGCPRSADPPAGTSPVASASSAAVIPPPPTAPPLPPPAVEVRMLGGKPAAFQVASLGDAVDLSRDVRVEQDPDSGRYPLGPLIQLTDKCDHVDAGKCVTLPAKGAITPVPWTGFDCDSQCPRACRANAYLGPGRFRYVVKSCDGTRQWESVWFDLPPYK